MTDNSSLPVASGNETFANDDIGGVKYPRVKVTWGPDGTSNDADVATGKPIPVQLRGSDGTDRSNALPASQSGTWTVQPGNTANTTAWKVDGSAVTQPVSLTSTTITGTVTVGSHAVTNAGTFLVQENGAAATSLALIDDTITAQGTALGSVKTSLLGGSVTTSAPTYTTGQINPLSMDTTGALRVTGAGGGTQYTEDVAAASDPVGNMLVAVRRDTLSTSEVSADGDNIAVKATNKGQVHVRAEIDSTQLATLNTAVKTMADNYQLVALPSDQVKIPVNGNTAHDGADADKPIKMGAYAKAAAPSDVSADADVTNLWALRNGALCINVTAAGALIPGDATNGLDIDVTRMSALVAGEAHVGEVGGKTAVKTIAMSTDTSAYASGDLIADTQQLDAAFRVSNGTGMLNTLTIIDQDAQGAAIYVMFHYTSTTMGTENSAPSISDANLAAGLQGIVAVATTDYVTVSGAKVATIKNIGLPLKAVSGTDDLYVSVLNGTGTPTYTATGLNFALGILQD